MITRSWRRSPAKPTSLENDAAARKSTPRAAASRRKNRLHLHVAIAQQQYVHPSSQGATSSIAVGLARSNTDLSPPWTRAANDRAVPLDHVRVGGQLAPGCFAFRLCGLLAEDAAFQQHQDAGAQRRFVGAEDPVQSGQHGLEFMGFIEAADQSGTSGVTVTRICVTA